MPKIAIVLTPGFADWEYALIGGTGGPFYGLDIQYFAPAMGNIRSQGGLGVTVSQDMDTLSKWQPKAVVVVGGSIWEQDAAPDTRALLTAQHASGTIIAGICGGTLALARAGLLNKVRHTSNTLDFLTQNADAYTGSKLFHESAAAIADNRVITAPGTAPVSFTAAVFESVGVDVETVKQFKAMMAAEHS